MDVKFNIEIPRVILPVVCVNMKFNIEIPRVIVTRCLYGYEIQYFNLYSTLTNAQ